MRHNGDVSLVAVEDRRRHQSFFQRGISSKARILPNIRNKPTWIKEHDPAVLTLGDAGTDDFLLKVGGEK